MADDAPRLKLKYRVDRSAPGGRYKARTGNCNGILKYRKSRRPLKPRKKQYGPF